MGEMRNAGRKPERKKAKHLLDPGIYWRKHLRRMLKKYDLKV
jgi:hypothetical protein